MNGAARGWRFDGLLISIALSKESIGIFDLLGLGGTVCVGESGSSLGDMIPLVLRLNE